MSRAYLRNLQATKKTDCEEIDLGFFFVVV
jgi:hypothetical protein